MNDRKTHTDDKQIQEYQTHQENAILLIKQASKGMLFLSTAYCDVMSPYINVLLSSDKWAYARQGLRRKIYIYNADE